MAREGSETAAQREGSLWRAKPVWRISPPKGAGSSRCSSADHPRGPERRPAAAQHVWGGVVKNILRQATASKVAALAHHRHATRVPQINSLACPSAALAPPHTHGRVDAQGSEW